MIPVRGAPVPSAENGTSRRKTAAQRHGPTPTLAGRPLTYRSAGRHAAGIASPRIPCSACPTARVAGHCRGAASDRPHPYRRRSRRPADRPGRATSWWCRAGVLGHKRPSGIDGCAALRCAVDQRVRRREAAVLRVRPGRARPGQHTHADNALAKQHCLGTARSS